MSLKVLVIGIGKMGMAHLNVLKNFKLNSIAAWAPSDRAKLDLESLEVDFFEGNLRDTIKKLNPSHVIISSPVETLFETTTEVITCGVKNILVEKPMILNVRQAKSLIDIKNKYNINIKVAYNRRFYSSLQAALNLIIRSKETIQSIYFEFNEIYPFKDGPNNKDECVKKKWLLVNSMHVIDLAFVSVGLPLFSKSNFNCKDHDLNWHPTGSIFYGSGLSERGIPFSYHANWKSPGNWKIEWMTNSTRYIFNPIEKLKVMKKGSFNIEEVPIDDSLDIKYKPGVYLQNKAFLFGDNSQLVSPEYAIKLLDLANVMGGYDG